MYPVGDKKRGKKAHVRFERNINKLIRKLPSLKIYYDQKFSNCILYVFKMFQKSLDLNFSINIFIY